MASVDTFLDAFDEYVAPRVGQTKNYSGLIDQAHKDMIQSFKDGDVHKAHSFSVAEQKEINAYMEDVKKQGPKAYATAATPEPKKVIPKQPSAPETPGPRPSIMDARMIEPDPVVVKKPDTKAKVKPPIGEIKVGRTIKRSKEQVDARIKGRTKIPDAAPIVKTGVWDTKATSTFLSKNRGKVALGGIGLGVAKTWIDGEDDDLGSTAGKAVKAGVVTAGAAYGAEYLLKKDTVQAMVRGETVDIAKSTRNKIDKTAKMNAAWSKLGLAGKIGLGVVGAATVLDLGAKGREHYESAQIQKAQERQIVERKERKKEKGKKNAYGNINDGEILFDLFDARSGHHKMGNAKF